MPHVILIGTLDSKLEQFLYLYQQLQEFSTSFISFPLTVTFIDCGRVSLKHESITICQNDLILQYGQIQPEELSRLPRGDFIKHMIQCSTACVKDLVGKGGVHGILSAGGSCGTSIVSAVMREAAPLGMPKLIVSTVASGDTGPIVEETDLTMMYSIVDIAGTNHMIQDVLSNAAGAMIGMATAYERTQERRRKVMNQPATRIGITMFGVTTVGVEHIVKHLKENYAVEIYIFHATGHGGKAMERLIEEGRLDAVLDLTTTEICDHLNKGNMSAGPRRLEAALAAGIPNIISVGATDMVNFGAKSTVPPEYRGRLLLEHNPVVTLMRTTKEECKAIGNFIVEKITTYAKDTRMVEVWMPHGGLSVVSTPGAIFADSSADAALFDTVKAGLADRHIRLVDRAQHINDETFAIDISESLMKLVHRKSIK